MSETEPATNLPAVINPEREPPESFSELARDYPGLVITGGLALGLLAGSLLPRGTARKLAQGAIAAATIGGEAGMTLARQAREKAAASADDVSGRLETISEAASVKASAARRRTAAAAGSATSAGVDLARAALSLLGALRR